MKTSADLQRGCAMSHLLAAAFLVFSPASVWAGERSAVAAPGVPPEYVALQRRLATGWNTWDTNDVLDSVLLPQAISVKIGLKHNSWTNGDEFLAGGDISLRGPDDPHIHVLHHSYDGS